MRLIDADALETKIDDAMCKYDAYDSCQLKIVHGLTEAQELCFNAPTIEAEPVKHGRWECAFDARMGETEVTCSRCKDTRTIKGCYVTTGGEPCYWEDNYCPNCGAKMDEEGEA